jgi:hypothetical protein
VWGYSYFLKLPFLVGAAPLAGYLYDASGGYGSTHLVYVTAAAAAAAMAMALAIDHRRRTVATA